MLYSIERNINLYSPKISENLIPLLYKKAKSEQKPMTQIVNEILKAHLSEVVQEKASLDYNKSSINPQKQS